MSIASVNFLSYVLSTVFGCYIRLHGEPQFYFKVFVIGRYTAPTPLRSLDILVCTGVTRMLSICRIVSVCR